LIVIVALFFGKLHFASLKLW